MADRLVHPDPTRLTPNPTPDERRWLATFLKLASWSTTFIAAVAVLIYRHTGTLGALLCAIMLLIAAALLLGTRSRLLSGDVERVGLMLYSIPLMSGMIGILLVPVALPAALMSPITAVILSLPYVSPRVLRWLMIVSLACGFAMVQLSQHVALFPITDWGQGVAVTLGVMQGMGLLLLLLWRYHLDLTTVRNRLETTVATRTAALQEREERFRIISELTSDYAYAIELDAGGRVINDWLTDAFAPISGYRADVLNRRGGFLSAIHPDDIDVVQQSYQQLNRNQESVVEFRLLHPSGEERWIRSYARPQWDAQTGHVSRIVGALKDITERRRYEQQIEQLAFFDALTGLANRRLFHDRATDELRSTVAPDTLAILFIDLDRFKTINDTLGHDVGDQVLVHVARRLRTCIRDGDLLARLGGDEFAILLPLTSDLEAREVALRMLEELDKTFSIDGQPLRVTGSIGVACHPCHGAQLTTLLKHADIAMYRAKERSQHVEFYRPDLLIYPQERLALETELRLALDRNELVLHYQPIIDLERHTISRAEALVRWQHPTRGLMPPGVFLPIAEECGLIRSLDRWVLRHALAQAARWAESGNGLTIAINLSVQSLHDHDLADYVAECLASSGAPGSHIMVEVTEGAAMHDLGRTVTILQQLKALGMQVALDDFGSGHASLLRLKLLPIDVIKTDREFLDGLGDVDKDDGVMRAMIGLARSLKLMVVAEGVENARQLAWLRQAGFDYAQGYYLGHPVPPEVISVVPPVGPAVVT